MKILVIWICLFLALSGLVVAYQQYFFDQVHLVLSIWKLSAANNKFSFELLRDFSRRTQKNIILCPISIYTTMGMLYFGAKGGTAKELERTLGYEFMNLTRPEITRAFRYILKNNLITVDPDAYVLDLANTILVNEQLGLSSDYKSKVEKYFKAKVELANFADNEEEIKNKLNGWVRNMTRGKIHGIIDYIDKSMDIIAVNAAYFKSKWEAPFPAKNTRDDFFYNGGDTKKLVKMMEQKGVLMFHFDSKVSVVQLPFYGRNISMFFILPREKDGLMDVEKHFNHDVIIDYIRDLTPKYVLVTIPKFNLTLSENLVPNLNRLGAKKMFQPKLANFSGIVPHQEVALGEIRHKAIIEVNEAGVEAAGVTATLSFKSLTVSEQFDYHFFANHPFMYVILDQRTELILFIGHVWNL